MGLLLAIPLIALAWLAGYGGELANIGVEAMRKEVKAVGAIEAVAVAVTWTASAGEVLKSSAAHGLNTGDVIYITVLAGGQGLVAKRYYTVEKVSTTEVKLSQTTSIVAESWTTSVTSTTTFVKLVEIAETRAAIVPPAAAKRASAYKTPVTIAASGACSYEYIGFYSATSAGVLYGIAEVPKETLSAAGSIEVKESVINLSEIP